TGGGKTHTTTINLTVPNSVVLVNTWTPVHTNGSTTLTITGPPTSAGNFLAVWFTKENSAPPPTVTDNLGGGYAPAVRAEDPFDNRSVAWLFYQQNAPAGVTSITFTMSSSERADALVREYRGVATSNALDTVASQGTGF